MIVKIPLDFTSIKLPCYNDTYDDNIFKDHCTYKKKPRDICKFEYKL